MEYTKIITSIVLSGISAEMAYLAEFGSIVEIWWGLMSFGLLACVLGIVIKDD